MSSLLRYKLHGYAKEYSMFLIYRIGGNSWFGHMGQAKWRDVVNRWLEKFCDYNSVREIAIASRIGREPRTYNGPGARPDFDEIFKMSDQDIEDLPVSVKKRNAIPPFENEIHKWVRNRI
tara:strand:+ start:7265 stop:7624 length:360 start_codon:yes stop_codon:yes gene_type:complete